MRTPYTGIQTFYIAQIKKEKAVGKNKHLLRNSHFFHSHAAILIHMTIQKGEIEKNLYIIRTKK